jgi:very-short-patch-repair endonuclease
MSKSDVEEEFYRQIQLLGLPLPGREYKFARDIVGQGKGIRKRLQEAGLQDWRFDFAWVYLKLAVEIEGGVWSRGRHVRGSGYISDMRKYNAAQLAGWTVLRYDSESVASGRAINEVEVIIKKREKTYRITYGWENE